MRWYGSPNEIVRDKLQSYSAAAKELVCVDKQVTGRGRTTEFTIHICCFDDERGRYFGLAVCYAQSTEIRLNPCLVS